MHNPISSSDRKLFIAHAQEVASFYGFSALEEKVKEERAKHKKNPVLPKLPKASTTGDRPEFYDTERYRVLKSFIDVGIINSPTPLFVHHDTDTAKKEAPTYFGLDIMCTTKSVAEAIIIQTSATILSEAGHKDIYVEINSLGDQESKLLFIKECSAYYRKHMQDLPAECKDALRRNMLDVMHCTKHKECILIQEEAPKPLNFLSDESRDHFQEVLEYLENIDIPYRINTTLMGTHECHTKTVFEIYAGFISDSEEENAKNVLLAQGGRYDELPRKIGFRRNLPAIGISFPLDTQCPKCAAGEIRKRPEPRIFLIQIGFSAKLLSLKVINMLRKENIEMKQSLSRDRLGNQLLQAESMKIPYTIIIGQREALEKTVIVRNMDTRSQESVSVADLSKYLHTVAKC
ncbi:hypothetical protein COB55_01675 [Candidatus Wolfebacteria bacterium]|nr:MAG: hypothetical protein COB55_01675 [Candidatus Wolfebacteria bacterium]